MEVGGKKRKDIARIDQESKRTHGWYVRVRFQGKTHSKFFSDGQHGGREAALEAATGWRNQTERNLGKVRTDRHIVTVSNTDSGVVGVRLNDSLNRYEVSWVNQEGAQGKTSISIRKHGKEKAFQLACKIRQEKESERINAGSSQPLITFPKLEDTGGELNVPVLAEGKGDLFIHWRESRLINKVENGAPVDGNLNPDSHGREPFYGNKIFLPTKLDPSIVAQLSDVLSTHFTNGYRLNSPIEMARFRTFAAEDLGKELTLADEELKSYIAACGTTFDGKVYAVSVQTKERIKELAEDYFADGAQVIFFAEFYAKNEDWLFEASLVSENMLIDIIRRLFPKLSFTQTYFGYTDASVFSVLEGEILRVWGDDILLSYEQLAERLRYIPLERIKYALGQNGDFIWSSVETFSHVCRIEITNEERQVIREAAVRECNARGYASITALPFGEIEERNHELSITAVHNAVYRICLSDKFDKKGKIVARRGDVFDALTIMKKYCRAIDKCSLDDLLTYEKELTGEVHRWIPMEAGNTVLVRIDKDTYVADRYVHFNADIIDEAIGLFVKGDYLPLKSFTTFGAFPHCGQTWNLFLLESYCRRFSRKFRFDTPSVNSRNAGAVVRKSCGMDYTEIMTDAVANANVLLKDTAVGKFLYESGYTGRSTTAKVNEIIDKAKAIRERRD